MAVTVFGRESAAPPNRKPHARSVSVTIEGVRYPSLRAASKGSGVSDRKLSAFLKQGKDAGREAERLLNKRRERAAREPRRFTVGGVTYPNADSLCKSYDISAATLNARLRGGMSAAKAVKVPTLPYQRYSFVFNRKMYYSVQQLADDYGLPAYLVSRRLAANGGNIAGAVGQRRQNPGKPVTVFGAAYDNLRFASEAYGVPVNTVYSRIRRQGMTLEEALTAPGRHT